MENTRKIASHPQKQQKNLATNILLLIKSFGIIKIKLKKKYLENLIKKYSKIF
jgi:hypothetical protein